MAFGVGAIAYFTLPVEPPFIAAGMTLASAILFAAMALRFRHSAIIFSVLLVLSGTAFGFGRAQWHSTAQLEPVLIADERARTLTGWIVAIQNSNGRERIIVRLATLDGAPSEGARVRFNARHGEFIPGDAITVRAVLSPPRRPAVPGGYDPAFAAWFSGLAGTGFAVEALQAAEVPGDGVQRRLARWRWQMAEHIRERAAPETAGIAAALLTGDRSGIPAQQAEALRAAGLGHILAISGLHMSLFAGGLFFAVRAGAAAIPAFARRYDPRIPAAIFALAGALAYLVLSGMSVSTQRAFVMVAVILLGTLFRRRAISMQSVAIAAAIILLLQPQSILSPGFQMSFAAASALIAAYDIWRNRAAPDARRGWIGSVAKFWGSLSLSSLVAGSATAAFAAFHFNRIAVYGFAANLLAMPIFSLVVMPAGALALALAPFGLDGPVLAVMSWGLMWVVGIAEWVSSWPGSLAPMAAAPGPVIALYALGFVLIVAASGMFRRAGLMLIIAAYAGWAFSEPPDIFISEDGVVLARVESTQGQSWTASDRRRSRFPVRVFLEQAGDPARPAAGEWRCDEAGCHLEDSGLRIGTLQTGESLTEACEREDLIILQDRASPIQRMACQAMLIDQVDLARNGAVALWREGPQIAGRISVEQSRGQRLWTQTPSDSGG